MAGGSKRKRQAEPLAANADDEEPYIGVSNSAKHGRAAADISEDADPTAAGGDASDSQHSGSGADLDSAELGDEFGDEFGSSAGEDDDDAAASEGNSMEHPEGDDDSADVDMEGSGEDGPGLLAEAGSSSEDNDDEEEDEPEASRRADAGGSDGDVSSGGGGDEVSGDEGGSEGGTAPGTSSGRDEQRKGAPLPFQQGGRDAGFAKAFSMVMNKTVRSQPSDGNLVLAKSHTATNRQKAEAEESRADAARRKQRLAMRKRGHKLVPKRGDDPTHDAREKQHVKLATRGVVLLFNAVAKAQKQKSEALAMGRKVTKLNKASFLADLRAASTGATAAAAATAPDTAAAAAAKPSSRPGGILAADSDGEEPGWEVLQQGFTGLQKGNAMKDWDRKADSDEDNGEEQIRDVSDDSDGDDGSGW